MEDLLTDDSTSEYTVTDFEQAVDVAQKSGFDVVQSTPTTLLLDLDNGQAQDMYRLMFPRLQEEYSLKEMDRWPSKSGFGLHVVISCVELNFTERILVQACLGSDPLREALALKLFKAGKENPSVLFRPQRKKSQNPFIALVPVFAGPDCGERE